METTQPSGILSPALTAFNEQFEIDAERTVAHFRWLLKEGCDGLVVFGTTSEANSLSVTERTSFLEYAVSAGIDANKLLPGTGCCSLPDSVVLTKHAVGLGCPGVLMLPPFYYKAVSDEGLFRYFATLIERVGDGRLRIYLYHIPPISQVAISFDLIERLVTEFPGVVIGVKDSSGDWDHTRRLIELFAPGGFRVFPGNEMHLLPALREGGRGCVSAFANINPSLLQNLFHNWLRPEADELQEEVQRQGRALRKYPVIPALKAILAKWRNEPEWENVRPPLVALSAEQREALLRDLAAVRFQRPLL
ncbi:MAG: dihydrodipicolinate synthase family protein [Chthoniobacterales bacterium]